MRIRIVGAGIAGLTATFEFARAGCDVELVDCREGPGLGCSYFAGGMLAPWCEAESTEKLILDLGLEALKFWTERVPVATRQGTLVVAPARDRPELIRFARRTSGFEYIGAERIAALEPDLAGRFEEALFFPLEAHLDPRAAMAALATRLAGCDNVALRYGVAAKQVRADWTIDCRGLAAQDALSRFARRQGRNVGALDPRDHTDAAGAAPASTPSGLYRAAGRRALHDWSNDDRK